MSWKDRALALVKRFGPAAKFATKQILGAVLPGSPAVIELVGQALDSVHESAKDEYELRRDAAVTASPGDLDRLEQMLAVLSGDLAHLVGQVAAFEDTPEVARRLLNTAIATDGRVQEAVKHLDELAGRFDKLEEQNRKLLEGQGYAAGMLEEMLPLLRRLAGVMGFVEEWHAAGLAPKELSGRLQAVQEAVAAVAQGRASEAHAVLEPVARANPDSVNVGVAAAVVQAVSHDLPGAQARITRLARQHPEDRDLAELQQRLTRATSLGNTPAVAATTKAGPQVGDVFDGWKLEALLGAGGWGQVFRARRAGQVAALKVMHPHLSADPSFAARFRREIMTLCGLRGTKHIVDILDFGHAGACWYFVMEQVEGVSLEDHLHRNGPLTVERAVGLFGQLAEGLAAAHAKGVVHRDIKPSNILLRQGDGSPVLVDFGIAAQVDTLQLTRTGQSAGYTLMFASPEQLRGKLVDARSDVYSLAGSMYYALSYDRPDVREPHCFAPEHVAEGVRELLAQALHERPEKRYAGAAAFRDALKATQHTPPRPPPPAVTAPSKSQNRPVEPTESSEEKALTAEELKVAPLGGNTTKFWCLNFDEPEVLEYGLKNNIWMMQYQYSHGGRTHQGDRIARIKANWKAVAKIKVGDWCVAYLKRNNFFAVGEVIAPRKKATHQDTVKRTLDEGPHLYYDGVVYYTDACGAFYEDHTDTWSLGQSSYAQRVDLNKWEYARKDKNGSSVPVSFPGLGKAVERCHDFIQNAAFQIDEPFFRSIMDTLKKNCQA